MVNLILLSIVIGVLAVAHNSLKGKVIDRLTFKTPGRSRAAARFVLVEVNDSVSSFRLEYGSLTDELAVAARQQHRSPSRC